MLNDLAERFIREHLNSPLPNQQFRDGLRFTLGAPLVKDTETADLTALLAEVLYVDADGSVVPRKLQGERLAYWAGLLPVAA